MYGIYIAITAHEKTIFFAFSYDTTWSCDRGAQKAHSLARILILVLTIYRNSVIAAFSFSIFSKIIRHAVTLRVMVLYVLHRIVGIQFERYIITLLDPRVINETTTRSVSKMKTWYIFALRMQADVFSQRTHVLLSRLREFHTQLTAGNALSGAPLAFPQCITYTHTCAMQKPIHTHTRACARERDKKNICL